MPTRVAILIGLLVAALAGVGAPDAMAASRVALVIGNDAYVSLPKLNNARKDAEDVAARLTALGWEVILTLDAGQRAMGRAIETFEGRLGTADAGLVFYAGHGVQARGENWLIPADADVEAEVDLRYEGIAARDILEAMKRSGTPLNIVILDACRDNPLRQSARSGIRGLAVPALPQGIKGTAVMFSAAPGETAQDGPPGGNGIFTGALLDALGQPGLKLEELFKETARRVSVRTANRQRPWFNSSVFGDFYFNEAAPAAPGAAAPAPGSPVPGGRTDLELAFWQSIEHSAEPQLFESYLEQYPGGAFAALARTKIRLLRGAAAAPAAPAAAPPAVPPDAGPAARPAARKEVETAAVAPAVAPADERARVEDLLANGRDTLQRELGYFMVREGHSVRADYRVQQIWRAGIVEVVADGYIVELQYEAVSGGGTNQTFDTRTLQFHMRLRDGALEFVALLPERG